MPFGQLLTTLLTVREAIGYSTKATINFSDALPDEAPLIYFFNWTLNSSTKLSISEINSVNLSSTESSAKNYTTSPTNFPETHNVNSLSIMWYLASFGTLVVFFLLISFSEVCCKKSLTVQLENESELSPPPYDLFAPPTYDSLYEEKRKTGNIRKGKRKYGVFVINVFGDKNQPKVFFPSSVPRDNNRIEYR